jgi:hypothetical protein
MVDTGLGIRPVLRSPIVRRIILQGLDILPLGAEGVLPSRHIVSLLRVFKQFTHLIPSGQMLSSFKISSPLWSQCALWVSFECVLKEPVNKPIRQPFERTSRVLSQFVLNGPATNLSHLLRVLSKCTHNVAIVYSIIYPMDSLRVCGKIEPM